MPPLDQNALLQLLQQFQAGGAPSILPVSGIGEGTPLAGLPLGEQGFGGGGGGSLLGGGGGGLGGGTPGVGGLEFFQLMQALQGAPEGPSVAGGGGFLGQPGAGGTLGQSFGAGGTPGQSFGAGGVLQSQEGNLPQGTLGQASPGGGGIGGGLQTAAELLKLGRGLREFLPQLFQGGTPTGGGQTIPDILRDPTTGTASPDLTFSQPTPGDLLQTSLQGGGPSDLTFGQPSPGDLLRQIPIGGGLPAGADTALSFSQPLAGDLLRTAPLGRAAIPSGAVFPDAGQLFSVGGSPALDALGLPTGLRAAAPTGTIFPDASQLFAAEPAASTPFSFGSAILPGLGALGALGGGLGALASGNVPAGAGTLGGGGIGAGLGALFGGPLGALTGFGLGGGLGGLFGGLFGGGHPRVKVNLPGFSHPITQTLGGRQTSLKSFAEGTGAVGGFEQALAQAQNPAELLAAINQQRSPFPGQFRIDAPGFLSLGGTPFAPSVSPFTLAALQDPNVLRGLTVSAGALGAPAPQPQAADFLRQEIARVLAGRPGVPRPQPSAAAPPPTRAGVPAPIPNQLGFGESAPVDPLTLLAFLSQGGS